MTKLIKLARSGIFAVGILTGLAPVTGHAQKATEYPQKPIRIVVPLTAGGPTDMLARIIAQPLSEHLKQPVIVENRPGAGGNIAAEYVANSPADGYTLLMGGSGVFTINISLYKKINYNPVRDFSPIIHVANAPFVIVAHPSVPVKSISELVALAKSQPGQMNYGGVPGNAAHLAAELFKSRAGIDISFIPYKGASPATNDLLAGHVQIGVVSTPNVLPYVKSGKLKALAVTSEKRLPLLPDVPTLAESGLQGYEAATWYGLAAPAKTPPDIVAKLNLEITRILQDKDVIERMKNNDFNPTGSTPEQLARFIQLEIDKWAKVIKSAGVQAPDQ
jgi:tripartite-type tricarboxylate transporter receptor subunit TctC